MPFVPSGPLDVYYEVHGEGPPLVLVMGLGVDGRAWLPLLPLFDDFGTVVFDNAGVGRTVDRATGEPPEPPYSTVGFAADLAALLRHLDRGPAHVVGVSMGGAIAMHAAALEPDLVRTLTLCATWPRADGLLRQIFALRRPLLERLGEPDLQRYVALFAWAPRYWEEGGPALAATAGLISQGNAALWTGAERRRYLGHLQASLEHDATAALALISAPTLVLVGDEDILTPLRFARAIAAAVPHARLEVVPGQGHAFSFENPELFARIVRGFVEPS
jgi:aminoacrylate hydrolase